ncbi:MAG: 50S ribosomal protein L18Ae [archaeon]|jgi:large subunit ribosomal protein LX
METKLFEVKGIYEKKGENQKFTKIVKAASEKMAKEKVLSQMGGKQRVKRANITIEEVKETKEK